MINELNRPHTQAPTKLPELCSVAVPSQRALEQKRLIDLFLLFLLAPPAVFLVAICAALTRLLTGGPALYKQSRVGYLGKTIEVWKLRTMELNAESILQEFLAKSPEARREWEAHYKLKNDPRIIPYLGNFLRRSSLDELPQLLNVWKGEMSFVGPRPLPAYHFEAIETDFKDLRQSVPPGLSGLWQISERSDADLDSHQTWDKLYIKNFSLWNDLRIILKTPLVILRSRGAR